MEPWNLWEHETYEIMKPWNHETYETYETDETKNPMTPWNQWNLTYEIKKPTKT